MITISIILAALFLVFVAYPILYVIILEETKHGDPYTIPKDMYWRRRLDGTITGWQLYKHAFGLHTYWCDVQDDGIRKRFMGRFICFICDKHKSYWEGK